MVTYRFGFKELKSSTSVKPVTYPIKFKLKCKQMTYDMMICWEVAE